MSKIVSALFALAFFVTAPAFAAASYSSVIEDLPLMPGMTEISKDALVFDTPSGRIAETGVETATSAAVISKFYAETLPPLGWKEVSAFIFIRENESLKINIEQKDHASHVRFSLSPKE